MTITRILQRPYQRRVLNCVRGTPAGFFSAAVPPHLVIEQPIDRQPFQVDLETRRADIPITVSWDTLPSNPIEARFNGGDWQTIIANPSGGGGSGVLTSQAGGQGALEIRQWGQRGVVATSTRVHITVGIVLIGYGQSNKVGSFENKQPFSSSVSYVALKFTSDGIEWEEGNEPINFTRLGGKGSLDPRIMSGLSEATGLPVVCASIAFGGTGYVASSAGGIQSDQDVAWATPNGYAYVTARQQFLLLGVFNAIGWHVQGERESGINTKTSNLTASPGSPSRYQEEMEATRAALSEALGFQLKVMITQTGSQLAAGSTQIDLVRQNQWGMPDLYPGLWFHGPVTCDIELEDAEGATIPEEHHWVKDWQAIKIARREVHCFMYNFFGGPGGRGPRIVDALVVDSTHILLTFEVANGGFEWGDDPRGFSVESGIAQTISSIEFDAPSENVGTALLTMAGPLPQLPAMVSCGRGDSMAGSTITDAADMSMEPFLHFLAYDENGPPPGDPPEFSHVANIEEEGTVVRNSNAIYVTPKSNEEPTPPPPFSHVANIGVTGTLDRNSAATYVTLVEEE